MTHTWILLQEDSQKFVSHAHHLAAHVQHVFPIWVKLLDQMYQLRHPHIAVIVSLEYM